MPASPQRRRPGLPSAATGVASLVTVAGSGGRLLRMARQVRSGAPLVPGLRSWSTEYARGLDEGAATLRRRP